MSHNFPDYYDKERIKRHNEFLEKLLKNDVTVPNEFTYEMGKLIRIAREEEGLTQNELANKMARRQATISDIENGKIEIGVLTLVQLAKVLRKPISYFIPDMTFLINIFDIQSKWEEEALSRFREIALWGNIDFTLQLLKFLSKYYSEEREREMGHDGFNIPDDEGL
jgi:transcriptional regulator with XRE-family HTH domain